VAGIKDILLYSHLVPAAVALLLSGYTLYYSRSRLSLLSFQMSFLFSCWVAMDMVIWFYFNKIHILLFAWSLIEVVSVMLFITTFLFTYSYVFGKDIKPGAKFIFLMLVIPVIILSSSFYLFGYDPQECITIENPFYLDYVKGIKILCSILILGLLATSFFLKNKLRSRTELTVLSLGILVFIYTFLLSSYIAEITADFRYEMAGLLAFIVFVGCLTFLTTKYETFQVKLVGAKAIVTTLVILSGSQILFFTSVAGRVVDIITVILVAIFSYLLIRSIKKEIQQRQQIEVLAKNLEKANARLRELDKTKSEFVSIASHQLRSPLTAMRGYASMLVEGSFGKLPEKALVAANRIDVSAKLMIMSVEDYLNVSRIESGNMKYNLSDFDVKEMVEHICDDIRPEAMKKNLVLLFRSDLSGNGIVNADVGKTSQIIHNLINNSLKYTPKGSINVFVRDDLKKKRLYISITDTGIGMSEATAHTLFQKFSRADNANSVNVSGTGLGLYVALKMAEQMGGTITCQSEGDGKGSTFTFELPLGV
jgi:signal transduction histidine kinase